MSEGEDASGDPGPILPVMQLIEIIDALGRLIDCTGPNESPGLEEAIEAGEFWAKTEATYLLAMFIAMERSLAFTPQSIFEVIGGLLALQSPAYLGLVSAISRARRITQGIRDRFMQFNESDPDANILAFDIRITRGEHLVLVWARRRLEGILASIPEENRDDLAWGDWIECSQNTLLMGLGKGRSTKAYLDRMVGQGKLIIRPNQNTLKPHCTLQVKLRDREDREMLLEYLKKESKSN